MCTGLDCVQELQDLKTPQTSKTLDSGVQGAVRVIVHATQHCAAAGKFILLRVCLFALLTLSMPFSGNDETEEDEAVLRANVIAGIWDDPHALEGKCSAAAAHLVTRMLEVDVAARATIDEVCDHEWVASG